MGYSIVQCSACGVAQISEVPSAEELERIYSVRYFDHKKYQLDQGAAKEMKRRMAILGHLNVAPGASVLDAGCATGDFICVAKKKYRMYGVDVSQSAIDIARHRNPEIGHRIFASELYDATIERKSLDAVVLWDVIEHVSDPGRLIRFLTSLLKPNGKLCLSTPNMASIMARLAGRRWAFMTPPEHQFFFSPRGISYLLQNCGLSAIYRESKGKWTSLGFVAYKLGRVLQDMPNPVLMLAQESRFSRIPIYVPSNDIMYIGAEKK
jgi:2-polyprenyl-3-methyl-5-hydroxy-6-metoxy-1,4-benzoquinol methylase